MTVIKFEDKENSSVIKPGINNAITRVFDAVVKYCLKQNLPKSADRDELIFTTDTHEFFRGNGKGLDLIPFNTVLLFEAFGNFPDVGVETKIYVDKSTSLMFTWNGEAYVALTSGENGEIIISPSDAKIGDLTKLATVDKTTVVAAINEVFNALVKIDIDSVITQINSMEIDITDIKNTLASGDVSAIANLEVKIGDLATLTTAEKTSLVGAINELRTLIGSGSAGGDAEIAVIVGVLSQLKTADKSNVVAAINEIFVDVESANSSISALELSITAIQGNQTTIENEVTVLQNTVATIDNSITQINSIIGTLSSLTTVEKTTIVSAINELVIQIGSLNQDVTDLSALTNQVNQIVANVGTLSQLSTTAKTNLVAAINELVGRIAGVDGEITAIKGNISTIESNIDAVEASVATNTQSITALSDRTTSVENRMTSLENVNLTEEDKQKYLEYQDLVQSLLDEMVPELQGRISVLEQEVANLKSSSGGGTTTPPDGGGGTDPDPTEPTALWSHEFVLPVGVATYELGEDPDYVANGYTMDMMEDLYGDTQKVRLYSLGNAGEAPTEPVEVPLVGTGGTPPTVHGVWESYTGTDVIFEVASLIAWRFRLVKYA